MTDSASTLPLPENESQKQPAPVPPKRPRYRWLKYTLFGSLTLVTGLGAGVVWLLTTTDGLRFALKQVPRFSNVQIETESLSGSVWHGFAADQVSVQTESADLKFSRVELAWQPQALWQRHLLVQKLALGDLHIATKPTPPKPKQPAPKLPQSISLPVQIDVQQIEVGKITQNKTEILNRIRAAYHYDHRQHLLDVQALDNYWAATKGQVSLQTQSPFALNGKLLSKGELDGIAVDNALNASGSLQQIQLKTDLTGNGVGLHASTQIRPFAEHLGQLIEHVDIQGQNINPRAFMPNLPQADLVFNLRVHPNLDKGKDMALDGSLDLRNEKPQAANQSGIPVRTLAGTFHINDSGAIEIPDLRAQLMKDGQITLNGGIYAQKQTLNLQAKIERLTVADAATLSTPIQGTLNGNLHAKGTFTEPNIAWQLKTERAQSTGTLKIATDTAKGQRTLLIENGEILPNQGGKLKIAGSLQLFQSQKLSATAESQGFNPAKLYPGLPEGNINGKITAGGELAKQSFQSSLHFSPSTVSGAPLSGKGDIRYENKHLSQANTDIQLGSNHIRTQGAFGKRGDTLALDIHAPNLHLFGFGLQGLLTAKGSLTSTADGFTQMEAKLAGQARQFAVGDAVKAQNIDFTVQASPDASRPLNVSLKGNGISAGGTQIQQADVQLNGTLRQHQIKAQSSLHIDKKPLTLNIAAAGGLNDAQQWHGTVSTLDVGGALQLRLQNAMKLEAGAKRVVLSAANWQALGGTLQLQQFSWDAQSGLNTKGSANQLHLAQLHNFYKPPVEHDLVIAANWDMSYSHSPRGFLQLKQQGGDVILPTARKQALNLSGFVLNTTLDSRGIQNQVQADTRYGKVQGQYNILRSFGQGNLLTAPVSGSLHLTNENLESLRNVMPIGQTVTGRLQANITIGGQVNQPKLGGTLTGDNLSYRHRQIGIILDNGTLKSHLDGDRWLVDSLQFARKNGTVTLTGSATLANSTPNVDAQVVFDRYPVLDQVNRQLTLSGTTKVLYGNNGFTLDGKLVTDEGRFGFQESNAPTLDDDVVVLGEAKPEAAKPMPFNLNLVFDLNNKFHFSGEGLKVTLGGQLALKSSTTSDIQAVGSVHVVRGQYKAYGQDLVVKKGIISFVGPISQPNLNIRAERRNSPVGAGVEVLGNLNEPRIRLVTNEPMSEKDKLSWLILNRASSGNSGDNAALATAASAFLAGKVADRTGLLDNFGLTSEQTRNAATGEMNPAQQVLTFGKQLTHNLSLSYEAGLQTSSQTVKLIYQLARSFQIIAKMGTNSSGVEVKYIRRFD